MANGIAEMMQKRHQALPKNGTKYNTSKANIRNKCWQIKDVWLKEKGAEID